MSNHQETSLQKKTPVKPLLILSLAALGVVYGDIGTSPLYAMSQIFFGHGTMKVDPAIVLGVVSLIFWALTLIVTLKYVIFVLRAEYEKEGGIFALLGLLKNVSARGVVIISGLLVLAAGLLMGDGIITPAISVLSAIEGLSVKTLAFQPYIIPITVVILTALFFFQYKGTAKLGRVFGIVMLVWFLAIAALGISQIIHYPAIFMAINPWYAIQFIARTGLLTTMFVLGGVVLVVTGGEALYADLGHFGVKPIRISWLSFVYPALILNYMGQGAFLLSGAPVIANNVFFSLVPAPLLLPMVVLAAFATIIASQALISGAFSLATQATSLDILPRFKTIHTSQTQKGQIYVPAVNWFLYIGCILLVFIFRSSERLASAYGLAVIGVMLTTSIAMYVIARNKWRWGRFRAVTIFGGFAAVELIFLFGNSLKFFQGGYVPLALGLFLFAIMMTWQWGRAHIKNAYASFRRIRDVEWLVDLKRRVESAGGVLVDEVGRTAILGRAVVFLSSEPTRTIHDPVPIAARVYLKRKGALPKCIVLLNISADKEPFLENSVYENVIDFGSEIYAVNARYGFMEEPDIRKLLADLSATGKIPYEITHCTIEVAEPEIIIDPNMPRFSALRMKFYKLMYRVTASTYRYFGLDADANISITLIPVFVTPEGTEVVRLDNGKLVI